MKNKIITTGAVGIIDIVSALMKLKKPAGQYRKTADDIINAGKGIAKTVVIAFDATNDYKITPEEELAIAERLADNRRELDQAIGGMIDVLKAHALERTK